jgi:hypothetical protein
MRFWCHDPDDLRPLFSGQCDLVAGNGMRILVVDYKTGWGDLTPAARNWQLRALVALVGCEHGLDPPPVVTAALIAPRLNPKVDLVEYSPDDVRQAVRDCQALAKRIVEPGQFRVASEESCRYCPCQAHCPEAQRFVEALALTTTHHRDLVSGDQLAAFLGKCGIAVQIIESFKAEAKRRLAQDPASVPGWELKPGAIRQKITDVKGVWFRASELGVSAQDFTSWCGLTKTALEEGLRESVGLKGKELKTAIQSLIQGCVEEKQSAPTLEKITGA